MNDTPATDRSSPIAYLLLAIVQILGGGFLVWNGLPLFKELSVNPGDQLHTNIYGDLIAFVVLLVMQGAYWYRFFCIRIPRLKPNAPLNHLLIFISRLSFIFGGAFYSVVSFRHIPALHTGVNSFLLLRHGLLLLGALFSLFCISLELERLGQALEAKQANLQKI